MNPTIFLGGVGCVALGVVFDRIYLHVKSEKTVSRTKVLEECFGAPMYTNILSITEVRDWVNARQDLLTESKAIVLKVNDETLKNIGKSLNLGSEAENMIIMAIVDESNNEIKESALIKYEHLEDGLEKLLGNDGLLVIEKSKKEV